MSAIAVSMLALLFTALAIVPAGAHLLEMRAKLTLPATTTGRCSRSIAAGRGLA
jgi:hypothetical protein